MLIFYNLAQSSGQVKDACAGRGCSAKLSSSGKPFDICKLIDKVSPTQHLKPGFADDFFLPPSVEYFSKPLKNPFLCGSSQHKV
jgi:hypothetical protein